MDEVRSDLEGGVLDRHDHYEVFLNPYARKDGRHDVLVTTRDEVAEPGAGSPGDGERHPLIEIQSSIPLVWVALRLAARWVPVLMHAQFGRTLRRMEDENYTQVSYRVFNIGAANHLPALSMEIAVPVEGDDHLRAVDRLLEVADECAGGGRFHTSPISLRFVAPSRAYASMMHGSPTMMIELILISGTRAADRCSPSTSGGWPGSRPPLGKPTRSARSPDSRRSIPAGTPGSRCAERFNESGVFDSEFTDRVGISGAVDFRGSRLSPGWPSSRSGSVAGASPALRGERPLPASSHPSWPASPGASRGRLARG